MDEKNFDIMIQSIREAGKIKRGEKSPSRVFAFSAD